MSTNEALRARMNETLDEADRALSRGDTCEAERLDEVAIAIMQELARDLQASSGPDARARRAA